MKRRANRMKKLLIKVRCRKDLEVLKRAANRMKSLSFKVWCSFTTKAVASTPAVAGIAFFTAFLQLPDQTQASGYPCRLQNLSEKSQPQVFFRKILCQNSSDLTAGFYGELPYQEVQNVLTCPSPEQAKTIWDLTQAKVQRGFTQPLERGGGAPFFVSCFNRGDGRMRLTDD